jgi:transposase InsO family protein
VRFAFIQVHARIWHITTMCRVLEVSRAGYYAWRARPLCERVKTDRVLMARIREIQAEVRQRYGSPRVRMELRALGFPVGKHRVARLLREAGVPAVPRRAFRVTTQAGRPESPLAPNTLGRRFALADHPVPDRRGQPTSRICRRGKGGYISRSCSTWPPGGSSAGRSGRGYSKTSRSPHSIWLFDIAAPAACSTTPIGGSSTRATPIRGPWRPWAGR